MSSQIAEKEHLASQAEWLTEQLRPYCNKRSQGLIAQAVDQAIKDVKADCGMVIDSGFCNRYRLPEPKRSPEYTFEQALFIALNHDDFYPDFSAVKGKFKPTAVLAASALNYLEGAQSSLLCGDLNIASTQIDTAIKLREHLASVIKRDDKQKKLIADSKAAHISRVRSKAAKDADRYVENMMNRQPIIDYFETVKTILESNSPDKGFTMREFESLAIRAAMRLDYQERFETNILKLTSQEEEGLANAVKKLLDAYQHDLDEGYLRRTIKRLTDIPST
ncbi:hypothetical protein ACMXYR_14425 [Neptuniibacter sp. QD29_5]|uniref:hypothetical protein n=1 Tax=Neptuniibacter sp. QD29_5 TaxID=3398207 RepID=UPI0039F60E12